MNVCVFEREAVHMGPDRPDNNINSITMQRPRGILQIDIFMRRGGGGGGDREKEDQTRDRKWVVCVCHPHIYICVCMSVLVALEQHILWFLPPYVTLAECFCMSDSPYRLCLAFSPGGLI